MKKWSFVGVTLTFATLEAGKFIALNKILLDPNDIQIKHQVLGFF